MDFSLGSTSLSSFVPTLAIPSLDIIIVAGIFIVFLFDALRSGAAHAGAVTLSLAVLYMLLDALPSSALLASYAAGIASTYAQIGILGVLFVLAFLLTNRIIDGGFAESGGFLQAILAALGATAAILVLWHSLPQLMALWDFNALINAIFAEGYRFWWILASLGLIAFARASA